MSGCIKMEPTGRHAIFEIDNSRRLAAVFSRPAAVDECSLVDNLRIDDVIKAAEDAKRYWNIVNIICVFPVHPTDVHFACRRAGGSHEVFLHELRHVRRGRCVVRLRFENLISR